MMASFLFYPIMTLFSLVVLIYVVLLLISKEQANKFITHVMKGLATTLKVLLAVTLTVLRDIFRDLSKLMEIILEATKVK